MKRPSAVWEVTRGQPVKVTPLLNHNLGGDDGGEREPAGDEGVAGGAPQQPLLLQQLAGQHRQAVRRRDEVPGGGQ